MMKDYETLMIGSALAAVLMSAVTVTLYIKLKVARAIRYLKIVSNRYGRTFRIRKRVLGEADRMAAEALQIVSIFLMLPLLLGAGRTCSAEEAEWLDEAIVWECAASGEPEGCVGSGESEDCAAPAAEIFMGGAADRDGNYYYRADNCMIRVLFRDSGRRMEGGCCYAEIDGDPVTRKYACARGAEDSLVITYAAEEICALLEDGRHVITLYGEDAAGNRTGPNDISVTGASECGMGGMFILDTEAPYFSVSAYAFDGSPAVTDPQAGAALFNSGFCAVVELNERNVDPGCFQVVLSERHLNSAGDNEAFSSGLLPDSASADGAIIFSAEISYDGEYQIAASGCDKAGNTAVFGAGFDAEGKSEWYLLSSFCGRGRVSVSSGEVERAVFYSDGSITGNAWAISGGAAAVEFGIDRETGSLPVKVSGSVTLDDGSIRSVCSEEWAYGNSASLIIHEPGWFRIGELFIEDKAGNTVRCESGAELLLDPYKPRIEDFSLNSIPAYGNLHSSDVPIRIKVTDSENGIGSGIGDVILQLYKENELIREELLHTRSENRYGSYEELASAKAGIAEVFECKFICPGSLRSDEILAVLTVRDNAGNESVSQLSFGIDADAPEIKVSFDSAPYTGNLFHQPVCARIEVRERHLAAEGIQIFAEKLDCENDRDRITEASCEISEPGRSVYRLFLEEDGEYLIRTSAQDLLGNRSDSAEYEEPAGDEVIIDRTAPEILVEISGKQAAGPEGPLYLSRDAVVDIHIRDAHFSGDHTMRIEGPDGKQQKLILSENALKAVLSEEGAYRISGSASDAAGNCSEPVGEITIIVDKTAPGISVSGAENGDSLTEIPTIAFRVTDRNISPGNITVISLDDQGQEEELPCRIEEERYGFKATVNGLREDEYWRLSAVSTDLAGNRVRCELAFSVNVSGPQFETVRPEECGVWLCSAVRPAFRIEDVDPVAVMSVQVNGRDAEWIFKDNVLELAEALEEDGKYTVTARVRDSAGYERTMEPEEYLIDRTAPVLKAEVDGGRKLLYTGDVRILLLKDDPDAEFSVLELDGEKADAVSEGMCTELVIPGEKPGRHELRAVLCDRAGNVSEEVHMVFTTAGNKVLFAGALLLLCSAAGLLGLYSLRKLKKRL